MELGFESARRSASQQGGFKPFRLAPDVWEPERVCAVRELGLIADEGLSECSDLLPLLKPLIIKQSRGFDVRLS